MKSIFLMSLVLCFCLSGCFFAKETAGGNKNTQDGPGLIQGLISMMDIQGITNDGVIQQSDILAKFIKKNAAKKVVKPAWYPVVSPRMDANRADECEVTVEPKTNAAAQGLISVGQLVFGAENAQQMVELPRQENNVYYGKLTQGAFPAGIYRFQAEGSKDATSFDAKMAMPSEFTNPAINSQAFTNGPMQIKISDGIQAEWGTPKKVEDYDRIFVQLFATTEKDNIILKCGVKESALNGKNTTKWNIPASYLEKFATGVSNAEIYLIRADLIGAQGDSIGEIEFDGIRAWVMKTSFVN